MSKNGLRESREVFFRGYGELACLDTEVYYTGSWSYVGTARGDDGLQYELVRNNKTMEMRCKAV